MSCKYFEGCICDWNWNNDALCSSCVDNLHGSDCSVVKLDSSHDPTKVQCMFTQGMIYTMKSLGVGLTETNTYVLYQGGFLTVMVCITYFYLYSIDIIIFHADGIVVVFSLVSRP